MLPGRPFNISFNWNVTLPAFYLIFFFLLQNFLLADLCAQEQAYTLVHDRAQRNEDLRKKRLSLSLPLRFVILTLGSN